MQVELMTQLPPTELRTMFWSLPVSEGSRAECIREGMIIAQNIVDNLTPSVQTLFEQSEKLTNFALEVKLLAQGLKDKLNMCNDMLKGMQSATTPQESILSKRLSEEVGDMMDFDHS